MCDSAGFFPELSKNPLQIFLRLGMIAINVSDEWSCCNDKQTWNYTYL